MIRTLTLVRTLFCLFTFVLLFSSQALALTTCDQCGFHIDCRLPVCKGCSHCQTTPEPASFFGSVAAPPGVAKYGNFQTGLIVFANNLIKFIIVAAGIFAFFNIIIAGYSFLGAGGDPKKIEQAWGRIWQSLLGLLFVAGSFVLAAIFGWLIFGDARAILIPKVYGPPSP